MQRRCSATYLAGLAVAAVASTFVPRAAADTLGASLDSVIDGPTFKHSHWGILVVELDSGHTLYERNADKLFVPASTTKLFSTAAALHTLGADYRFQTPVHERGTRDAAGVLTGDLILVAQGDLCLGGRTDPSGRIAFKNSDHTYAGFSDTAELTEPEPLAGLNELSAQVAAAGIKRVTGDILIDDRLFDAATGTGSGPGRVTPILVNDNVVDFTITPGQPGQSAAVAWRPQTAACAVDAAVDTLPAGAPTQVTITTVAPGRMLVRGTIAADRKPLVRAAEVDDPAAFARALFIEALRRAGVAVTASPLGGNNAAALPQQGAYEQLPKVANLTSLPFAENARLVLKVSHNLHASTLPLLMAARHGKRTLDDGLRLQREFLLAAGVEADSISFGGGAGGDPADYVTPRAAIALLRYMAGRPDYASWVDALPILGVDGTLATAVSSNCAAKGKFQAKTGTLLWNNRLNGRTLLTSKALAGYGETAGGKKLALAMFVNHVDLATSQEREKIGQVLGALCETLYQSQ